MISSKVQDSLERNHFIRPYDTVLLDKLINFTRNRILEIRENGKSHFHASELSDILDLKEFFGFRSVENHQVEGLDHARITCKHRTNKEEVRHEPQAMPQMQLRQGHSQCPSD